MKKLAALGILALMAAIPFSPAAAYVGPDDDMDSFPRIIWPYINIVSELRVVRIEASTLAVARVEARAVETRSGARAAELVMVLVNEGETSFEGGYASSWDDGDWCGTGPKIPLPRDGGWRFQNLELPPIEPGGAAEISTIVDLSQDVIPQCLYLMVH